jgi:thioredoxin-dependent adenylylsulfate APS reductase
MSTTSPQKATGTADIRRIQDTRRRDPLPDAVAAVIQDRVAESWSPQEILTWGIKNFSPGIALSCSFGAPEGLALIDMMQRIDSNSRVFVLDTGRLPQATYDLIDRVRERYELEVEVVFPDAAAVTAMVRQHGMNLFYESVEQRQRCCGVRKVEPLNAYLGGLDAWVSGLRRDQNVTRTETAKIAIDHTHGGMVKFNPIADWTREQVVEYVRAHQVPTNRLHAKGYPSVGCDPCSRAIRPGEDQRAGRWWWENAENRECGIHYGGEGLGSGI